MAKASSKPKALITGIEGFTGRYLADVMAQAGYEVFGTARNDSDNSANIFNLDLCDPQAVKHIMHDIQPDVVAHLAAMTFVADRNVSRIYETNVLGSLNLLEALGSVQGNVPRGIMLASSATIYGSSPAEIINEESLPNPNNDYAVSKYAMEKLAHLWMSRLPVFIVRPFNYTGVGQHEQFLISKIVSHFRKKEPVIELGNLDVWREFGDVRFVARTYGRLLDLCPSGKTINICSGKAHSLREVITLCEHITGHHIEVQVNPKFVRNNEVRILQGDNSLLKGLIGESPMPSLEETLTWMLQDTEATPN
jgi:nucleoside-diphosphate-sugar epimerase